MTDVDDMKDCQLKQLLKESDSLLHVIESEDSLPRLIVDFRYKGESFSWTIHKEIACCSDFSAIVAPKISFLLDSSNEKDYECLHQKGLTDILANRGEPKPHPITFEDNELIVTSFEELATESKFRNVQNLRRPN